MTLTTINFNTKRIASILIDTTALLLGRPVQLLGLSANISRGSYSPSVLGFLVFPLKAIELFCS